MSKSKFTLTLLLILNSVPMSAFAADSKVPIVSELTVSTSGNYLLTKPVSVSIDLTIEDESEVIPPIGSLQNIKASEVIPIIFKIKIKSAKYKQFLGTVDVDINSSPGKWELIIKQIEDSNGNVNSSPIDTFKSKNYLYLFNSEYTPEKKTKEEIEEKFSSIFSQQLNQPYFTLLQARFDLIKDNSNIGELMAFNDDLASQIQVFKLFLQQKEAQVTRYKKYIERSEKATIKSSKTKKLLNVKLFKLKNLISQLEVTQFTGPTTSMEYRDISKEINTLTKEIDILIRKK